MHDRNDSRCPPLERRPARIGRLLAGVATLALALMAGVGPAAAQPVDWKTGREFRLQLDQITRVTWVESPMRDGLLNLSQHQGVAVWLDRRVDPDQRVDFDPGPDRTLEELLAAMAEQLGLGYCVVDAVVYMGPPATARDLATLRELQRQAIGQRDREFRQRWMDRQPMQWEVLAEPRELVSRLATELHLTIEDPGQLPHDVWPAWALPPLPAHDRLSLLLAGFDLTYELDDTGSRLRLVPISGPVLISRNYRQARVAVLDMAALRESFPQATIDREGGVLIVSAPLADHQEIENILEGRQDRPARPVTGQRVYTLQGISAPAGDVVATVARQLEWMVRYEGDAAERATTVVEVDVENVPIETLLDAALTPAGLTFELTARLLIIRSAD